MYGLARGHDQLIGKVVSKPGKFNLFEPGVHESQRHSTARLKRFIAPSKCNWFSREVQNNPIRQYP